MNRRSFFKSLAVLTGGIAAAPQIFIPKLIEVPKRKVLLSAAFDTGGAIILPELYFPTIELLRNRLIIAHGGFKTWSGLCGNIKIPRGNRL